MSWMILLYFSKLDPLGNITFVQLKLKIKLGEQYRPTGPLVCSYYITKRTILKNTFLTLAS